MSEEIKYNKILKEIINKLSSVELTTLEDFREIMHDTINSARSIISINKIVLELKTNLNDKEIKDKMKLIDKGNINKDAYIFKYEDEPYLNIKISFYPDKDSVYKEIDINRIDTICNILLSFYIKILESTITITKTKQVKESILPNIDKLNKYGTKLLKEKKLSKYNLMCLNIKDFRYINNAVGINNIHKTLNEYYNGIIKYIKDDEMIVSLGSDNFAILSSKRRTKKLIELIQDIDIRMEETDFKVECRIGIYDIQDNIDIYTAVEYANMALQILKEEKKGYYLYFTDEMKDNFLLAKEIVYKFNQALEEDAFEVYYQPKVDSSKNKIIGAEALVRWPDMNISPAIFVPILESENLIEDLDFYVLDTVCSDIERWKDMGINPVPISVNISRNNLSDIDLGYKIGRILNEYELESDLIEIEITETAIVKNKNNLLDFINEMKNNNIKISIDDFGVGESSLSILKELDVDTIKIDKAFIDDYTTDKDEIILRNIINLIQELNLNIVVEGVETKDQIEFLKRIDCNIVQGYYYDKPLNRTSYESRLMNKVYDKED